MVTDHRPTSLVVCCSEPPPPSPPLRYCTPAYPAPATPLHDTSDGGGAASKERPPSQPTLQIVTQDTGLSFHHRSVVVVVLGPRARRKEAPPIPEGRGGHKRERLGRIGDFLDDDGHPTQAVEHIIRK